MPVVKEFSAGDGDLPTGDELLPDGDGLSNGDGLLPNGDGLSAATQTLSAVEKPALSSTSEETLHMVQFAQVFWFNAVENFPVEHATQALSVVVVPLANTFWPATQAVQSMHEPSFAPIEYFPVLQDIQARSAVLVPFVAMYCPTVQFVHGVHESSLLVVE